LNTGNSITTWLQSCFLLRLPGHQNADFRQNRLSTSVQVYWLLHEELFRIAPVPELIQTGAEHRWRHLCGSSCGDYLDDSIPATNYLFSRNFSHFSRTAPKSVGNSESNWSHSCVR